MSHILHLSGRRHWQGGERQLTMLLTAPDDGFSHFVVCPQYSRLHQFCIDHKIEHVCYRYDILRVVRMAFFISTFCRKFPASILHCHDSRAHWAVNLAIHSCPYIVQMRASRKISNSWLNFWRFNRPYLRKVISPSKHVQNYLKLVVENPKLLEVIPYAINKGEREINDEGLRRSLGLSVSCKIIGTLGGLRARKNLELFIDSAQLLMQKITNVHFVIIGEGPKAYEIQQLIYEKNLQEHITLLGFRDDAIDCLSQFDVFWMTSKSEGFSTVLLESMDQSVPVVVSAIGGLMEIVEDEISGLLADSNSPEDFVSQTMRLLDMPSFAEQLAKNARLNLKSYNGLHMTLRFQLIYRQLDPAYKAE